MSARLAEDISRQEWVEGVKQRLGLVQTGDGSRPWRFFAMSPQMVSLDLERWHEVPEGVPLGEFLEILRDEGA
jgi:hypothetical protein